MSTPLILAADLDGTMAHGTAAERAALVQALANAPDSRLVYVTGRTPESAREIVLAHELPEPDVLIADVGTSVLHGLGPERAGEIEAELDARWPGSDAVHVQLAHVKGISPQEVDSPRRVSCWIDDVRALRATAADPFSARPPEDASFGREAAEIAARVGAAAVQALAPLHVDVVVSANVFLDVLPRGVHKGSTLRRVLEWLGGHAEHCVVAGDSLNDLSLFRTGLRGIVVGNCEPALLQRLDVNQRIYRARGSGPAGVLEGLRHFGLVGDGPQEGDRRAK
ncbi:MAG TPA: HAD family hydrolase [Longimicrobiales bacterium]|nr:HAD family hydrolase [Longimicrobiales bacterium]